MPRFSPQPAGAPPLGQGSGARELRLDFFRGLALIFIFLDHIPSNQVNWLTIRNFGLSDATEIFVFISGYAAMLAYGGAFRRSGLGAACLKILRRCWQIYAAHVFLFVVFTALIAYLAAAFERPALVEEMNIARILAEPHIVLVQALALRFMPTNMDVLPLYIVLLGAFPLILLGMRRHRGLTLALSFALYLAARQFHWNLPSYPDRHWFFDPFAWQFLFVLGAAFGRSHGTGERFLPQVRFLTPLAAAYLLFGFLIVLSWHLPELARLMPDPLRRAIYPIDKSTLDPLRLLHFLALAWLTVRFVPGNAAFLSWRIFRPVMLCGRQSLHVFCAGIFLAFVAHFMLEQIDGRLPMQILVSFGGIALMSAMAYGLTWYKSAEQGNRTRMVAAAAE